MSNEEYDITHAQPGRAGNSKQVRFGV